MKRLNGSSPLKLTDNEYVVRTGKIFEAGEYPDKELTVTEEELAQLAEDFRGMVPQNIEHEESVFDGKLGWLVSVYAKGKELFGSSLIPRWLDTVLGEDDMPVSVELKTVNDRLSLEGLALTVSPRVSDAQLLAAYSTFKNEFSRNYKPAEEENMASERQANWLQKLWERLTKSEIPEEILDADVDNVMLVATDNTKPDDNKEGDKTPPVAASDDKEEDGDDNDDNDDKKLNAQAGDFNALLTATVRTAAENFYQKNLLDGKVSPAEKDYLVKMFISAAIDDGDGKSCFSNDGTLKYGKRLTDLTGLIEARPKNIMTTEQIPANATLFALSQYGQKDVTKDRLNELRKIAGIKEVK